MKQSAGFEDPNKPQHCCRLIKALYELKQRPRAWHHCLSYVLGALGFTPSIAGTCLFILHHPNVIMYLLVYVDDMIVIRSVALAIPRPIVELSSDFAIEDIGTLYYFFRIEVGVLMITWTSASASMLWSSLPVLIC